MFEPPTEENWPELQKKWQSPIVYSTYYTQAYQEGYDAPQQGILESPYPKQTWQKYFWYLGFHHQSEFEKEQEVG